MKSKAIFRYPSSSLGQRLNQNLALYSVTHKDYGLNGEAGTIYIKKVIREPARIPTERLTLKDAAPAVIGARGIEVGMVVEVAVGTPLATAGVIEGVTGVVGSWRGLTVDQALV